MRYTKTPLAKNPTQIDYGEYHEQDGLKVPLRMTISRPKSRLRVQMEDVKFNAPIDEELEYPISHRTLCRVLRSWFRARSVVQLSIYPKANGTLAAVGARW